MTGLSASSRAFVAPLWLGFFTAVLLAWAWLWQMAGMAGLDALGRPTGRNMMPMVSFGPIFGMWTVMMAAMMLPTLVPTLRAYGELIRPGLGTRTGWVGIVGGYFATWVGFAALLAAAQSLLVAAGLVDELGVAGSRGVAGALIAGAGMWQLTRAKEICHGVCISPMGWFIGRWRPGFGGGARMGAGLGAFCVGCCWPYMVLMFVGGTMNLVWMGAATLLMVLEKLPQVGLVLRRPIGIAMIAGGIAWGVL